MKYSILPMLIPCLGFVLMAVASAIDWNDIKTNIIAILCVSIIPLCFGILGLVFNTFEKKNIAEKTFKASEILNVILIISSILFFLIIFVFTSPN